jgi:21S rRNA (GM2251-2'-O)-methyltransferase
LCHSFNGTHAGNEGYGLRTNVRRACTGLVKVSMASGFTGGALLQQRTGGMASNMHAQTGQQNRAGSGTGHRAAGVDSLNVSVAAGILLHDLLSSARRNHRQDQA